MVHQLGGGSHRALKLDAAFRIRTSENCLPRGSVNRVVGCPHRREGLIVGILNKTSTPSPTSCKIHRRFIADSSPHAWMSAMLPGKGGEEDLKTGL